MENKFSYNEAIKDLLSRISTLDEMLGPTEMICGWFNDLYFPCHDSSGFNEGVWEKGQRDWRSCFSDNELALLAHYHDEFEKVVNKLSDDPISFVDDSNWIELSRMAGETLMGMKDSNA